MLVSFPERLKGIICEMLFVIIFSGIVFKNLFFPYFYLYVIFWLHFGQQEFTFQNEFFSASSDLFSNFPGLLGIYT